MRRAFACVGMAGAPRDRVRVKASERKRAETLDAAFSLPFVISDPLFHRIRAIYASKQANGAGFTDGNDFQTVFTLADAYLAFSWSNYAERSLTRDMFQA